MIKRNKKKIQTINIMKNQKHFLVQSCLEVFIKPSYNSEVCRFFTLKLTNNRYVTNAFEIHIFRTVKIIKQNGWKRVK